MAIDEVDSMLWEQQPSSVRPFSRAYLFVKRQSLQHNNFQTRKDASTKKMIGHRSDDEEDEASLLAYSRTSFRMPRIILRSHRSYWISNLFSSARQERFFTDYKVTTRRECWVLNATKCGRLKSDIAEGDRPSFTVGALENIQGININVAM